MSGLTSIPHESALVADLLLQAGEVQAGAAAHVEHDVARPQRQARDGPAAIRLARRGSLIVVRGELAVALSRKTGVRRSHQWLGAEHEARRPRLLNAP